MQPLDDIHAELLGTLKRYWGYDSFRPVQEEIIRSVCQGRDTLALMPTGGGKSLTYQVPTMAREGLCIVVTPLIALMKDQVDRLRARRIPAVAIHSGLSPRQIDIALDNCAYGDVKFLYIAPERIDSELFRTRFAKMRVSLLAVDEAHCISQWGYDFRPSYLRIAELRERLPGVPVLALTASATKPVAEDIMRHLRFAEPHILRSSFARPNLSYSVRRTDDKQGQLLRLVQNVTKGLHVNEKIVDRAIREYLPFLATENIMMEAVKRGGDRQQLHEVIRRHSMAATKRMKEGLPCDLLDRLAADPAFGLTRPELEALMEPQRYIGRCPQQVARFLERCQPLLAQAQTADGTITL